MVVWLDESYWNRLLLLVFSPWAGLDRDQSSDIFGENLVQKQHQYYFDFVDFAFTVLTTANPQCSWFG